MEYFGQTSNSGDAADGADPNGDGLTNLEAFAAGLNPNESGVFPLGTESIDPATLDVTYTRSRAAVADGLVFTVEWCDTLTGVWSSVGVTQTVATISAETQRVNASVPTGGNDSRFARLSITRP